MKNCLLAFVIKWKRQSAFLQAELRGPISWGPITLLGSKANSIFRIIILKFFLGFYFLKFSSWESVEGNYDIDNSSYKP